MELSSTLLDILRCPVSGDKLIYDKQKSILISQQAALAYPIRDGIPLLLESESIPLKKVNGVAKGKTAKETVT